MPGLLERLNISILTSIRSSRDGFWSIFAINYLNRNGKVGKPTIKRILNGKRSVFRAQPRESFYHLIYLIRTLLSPTRKIPKPFSTRSVADPRGGTPLWTKIFLISCSFFLENLANLYIGTPSWRVGAQSYEEYCISPWRWRKNRGFWLFIMARCFHCLISSLNPSISSPS